jgi:hypothetical protein
MVCYLARRDVALELFGGGFGVKEDDNVDNNYRVVEDTGSLSR